MNSIDVDTLDLRIVSSGRNGVALGFQAETRSYHRHFFI